LRYLHLLTFMAVLVGIGLAVEWLLRAADTGVSLRDPRGIGQITVFLLAIAAIMLFQLCILRVSYSDFFGTYLREWRKVLRGLFSMFAFAAMIVVGGYLFLGLVGQVQWSQEGWTALTPELLTRAAVGLVVVLVLATTEELIFRGFVLRYLRWNESYPVTIAAVVASAAVFAVSHVIAKTTEPMTVELLFGLFLLGLLLGTTYVATGSLACSIGVHAGLLGMKVLIRKTQLLELSADTWWLADKDLRLSPVVWVLFAAMTAAILLGCRYRHRLAIEPMVGEPRRRGHSAVVTYSSPAE
jgi:membrane protease YdiL (CAAX protease family)